jgi:hypothetical protein
MFIGMTIGLVTATVWLTLVLIEFDREVARYEALHVNEDGVY